MQQDRITVFDGANCIGGNKIFVELNGKSLFLDFGMNFSKYTEFFQDFLAERSVRGLYDFVNLGIIPKIDVYREDLIPSDLDVSFFRKIKVDMVFVSHAHLDHWGNIGLLREDIPLIMSPITAVLIKSVRDTGMGRLGSEVPYVSPRVASEDSRILEAQKNSGYKYRPLVLTERNEKSLDFLLFSPSRKKFENGNEITALSDDFLKVFPVDHSVPGATGVIVDETVAYTGDFRFHGKNGENSKRFLKEIRNVPVLIIEGTRLSREERPEANSEDDVKKNIECVVEETSDIIVVDFPPRNVERLEAFRDVAKKVDREFVITEKLAYMLWALSFSGYEFDWSNVRILSELRGGYEKLWQRTVRREFQDRYIDPKEISANKGSYILALSYFTVKNLLDIRPDHGVYIYSSSEAFEEEQEFDFIRLYSWLKLFNLEIYGFEMVVDTRLKRLRPMFDKRFHVSGHLSKEEIIKTIEFVDPDVLIPVHTNDPKWFEQFDCCVLPKEGVPVVL